MGPGENVANGPCHSYYSVEQLPWGCDGRSPDQQVSPTQPTALTYSFVRLTLQPQPCNTGVAVIQLAKPMDGSGSLQVLTYDAEGAMQGNNPDLSSCVQNRTRISPVMSAAVHRIDDTSSFPLTCSLKAIASTCRADPSASDGSRSPFGNKRSCAGT